MVRDGIEARPPSLSRRHPAGVPPVLRLQVFLEFADNVQAVSCDEALLDVSSRVVDADEILGHAQRIREAIAQRTGCQASIGAAHNILLAKYAWGGG